MVCELILKTDAILGEGSLWDDENNRLLWLDIMNGEIHALDTAAGKDTLLFKTDEPIGTVVTRACGGLLVAAKRGFAFVNEQTGRLDSICNPEEDKPKNRFNRHGRNLPPQDGRGTGAGRGRAGRLHDRRRGHAVGGAAEGKGSQGESIHRIDNISLTFSSRHLPLRLRITTTRLSGRNTSRDISMSRPGVTARYMSFICSILSMP